MYDYKFNFPNNYDPSATANADDYYFCQKTFDNYVTIIESCIFHDKGPLTGTPLILSQWQKDIIAALFCLKHKETDKRRYNETFIYVPRKNGKSLFCSAMIGAYLILDEEKGKEVVSVAASEKQASLIYDPLRKSLRNTSNPLNSPKNTNPDCVFKVLANPKLIISENELNKYRPITADGGKNHGLNVSLSVMDELHAWPIKGIDVYEAVKTSAATRLSYLNIMITTADFNRDSICNSKFAHANKVCKGDIDDPRFLPVMYFLDKGDDWEDEKNWAKVNPQLGKSIPIEFYRDEVTRAKHDPTYINSFKRLYLNIQTQVENKFLDFNKWCDLEDKETDLTGLECFGGLDLAYKNDLCAFVLEFPHDDKYHVKSWFWIPEGHRDLKFYADKGWIDAENVIVTEGNGIDFGKVRRDIIRICDEYSPIEIGFDPRYATELCQSLYNDEGLPMTEVGQTARNLSEPLKDIAVGIIDGKFAHDGNNCASWQIGNATCKELEGGMIRLVKPMGKDTTKLKVDFVAALSIAHSLLLFNGDEFLNNYYMSEIDAGRPLL